MTARAAFFRLLAILTFAAGFVADRSSAAEASTTGGNRPTLFVCGDSTAARDRPPILGWGEEIGAFFDPAKIRVENRARGGRSARTFIEEGLWRAVESELHAGDIVFLQFGHNDSKSAMSLVRYDLSGTGEEVETVANTATGQKTEIHTYGYYLRQMIESARGHGATVVVLASVPRCNWRNGKVVRGEEEHVRWASEVAKAENVPFIDVNAIIANVYDPIGRAKIKALYFPQDNTHTNPAGAKVNAACVVAGLAAYKLPNVDAVLKPDAVATAAQIVAGVKSAAADLTLSLPVATAFPAAGAKDVCPDTPLRLTFNDAPTLGTRGKIHIIDIASGRDADTIDVSSRTATKTIGTEPNFVYYPVIVTGRVATIYPRNGALHYGRTYVVTADPGVFVDANAPAEAFDGRDLERAPARIAGDQPTPYGALDRSASWSFSTKPAPPPASTTAITVAADGSGDFCTVQGATDFVPDGNQTPRTITVRKGTYVEIVFFTNKHALTLVGEVRKQTVIEYPTNDRFNHITANPFGTNNPNPSAAKGNGHVYHRGVFLAHHVDDLVLANLTIRNTTPQGGSQAEAIILNGTTSARAILKDVDLYSYQDTLQINGQAYLSGCYIEGDVDFMWGTGPCFFENCTCRSLRSGAYYTQIRNPGTNHGYVYLGCTFDGAQGIMGNYLSRIGTGRFPYSEVVLIDCTLTTAVGPVAWQFQGGREGNERNPADVHFWEFNSHDPAGKPVDTTFRLAGSKRLTEPADATAIANYRNPTYVLGNGWNPKAAPIFSGPRPPAPPKHAGGPAIVIQPASQLVLLGTGAAMSIAAQGGSSRLTYQWYKNGTPVPGATSPTFRIDAMTWADAANYAVQVSDGHDTVTSDVAELTTVAPQAATPPDLPKIPATVFDVTSFGALADGTTDNTAAFQHAIDTAISSGGGIVTVPAGEKPYLCGPLKLGSNLDLEIQGGATVQLLPYSAEPKSGTYPFADGGHPTFLTAAGAHDVAITGAGTIDGDGGAWWAAYRADHSMPHRPFLVRLSKCERVLVSGVTFTRSPMFHVAINAKHLTVFGIAVRTPDGTPNTDGVDPSGSHHLIQNCAISCGDDNVVMKPGGAYCSDITVADCAFGEGHGMSVGGQTNRGLKGMLVKNCSFDGTTSALRLKADPTQGGNVEDITYTNITMQHVQYPIVFYSYYNKVGNPGATEGGNLTTPAKVRSWNAQPPNSLASKTLPAWHDITINGLYSSDTLGYSIIWGLPLRAYFISDVRLHNVQISGGPGFELYNAANVQVAGESEIGRVTAENAAAIVRQPRPVTVSAGGEASFTTQAVGAAQYQWTFNGRALADGPQSDGTKITGASTATLTVANAHEGASGKYAVVIDTALDTYDTEAKALAPASAHLAMTSDAASLTVAR